MKTLLTLLAIGLSISAQALSFTWGSGTTAISFDGTTITDGSVKAYLFYLGSSSSATWSIDGTENSGTTVQNTASTSTGFASTKGRISATFNQTYGSDIGTGTFVDGATFGVFLTYTDAGKTWYNYSGNTYTVSGAADDTSTLSAATFSFDLSSKTTLASGQSASAGGGWTAVPEPSTAALALAGLALLLKRRKA